MRHWFFAHTYLQVGLQIAIALTPYGLGLVWAFSKRRIWEVDGVSIGKEGQVKPTFLEVPGENL
jgi:hypothetical protein